MRKSYHVEVKGFDCKWRRVTGSEGLRSYAVGFLHGICCYYPRAPHRVIDQLGTVIEQDRGASAAKPATVTLESNRATQEDE